MFRFKGLGEELSAVLADESSIKPQLVNGIIGRESHFWVWEGFRILDSGIDGDQFQEQ